MPSYVITGANRGIGFEFVRQLSANPQNVIFALVRNKSRSTNLISLQSKSNKIHIFEADITDVKALKVAVQQVAVLTGGTLDTLINNAGFVPVDRKEYTLDAYPEGQEKILEDDFLAAFNINVLGVIHTTNVFLPLLRATANTSTARVITLSTGLADSEFTVAASFPVAVPYSVSKAAVNIVVAKYAVEYKKSNIVFLAISPGLVNTSLIPPTPEELEGFKSMVGSFQEASPKWDGNPITPEVSVRMMLKVIENTLPKDSGAFVSHYGDKQWL